VIGCCGNHTAIQGKPSPQEFGCEIVRPSERPSQWHSEVLYSNCNLLSHLRSFLSEVTFKIGESLHLCSPAEIPSRPGDLPDWEASIAMQSLSVNGGWSRFCDRCEHGIQAIVSLSFLPRKIQMFCEQGCMLHITFVDLAEVFDVVSRGLLYILLSTSTSQPCQVIAWWHGTGTCLIWQCLVKFL